MNTRQISVFLENKKGRLAGVTSALSSAGVNIEASFLSDSGDFGVLHLIPDNYSLAWDTLKKAQFVCTESNVFIIKVQHQPGNLARTLSMMEARNVEIEYMYSLPNSIDGKVLILFRFVEHEKAVEKLSDLQIEVFRGE